MEQLFIYHHPNEIPPLIHQQIVDFLRMEWPEGFMGPNRLRAWISHVEEHPVNFLLAEDGVLISHLEVVWKYLEHAGVTYKTYGLTGVFTYPQFRKQGYGLRLLKEAYSHIIKQDGDIVMFNSQTIGFYEKGGFEGMDKVVTLEGGESNPTISEGKAFMLFLSDKGKQGRKSFETQPVYFGENTW
jgi:GNAT superfamily N-acetyltransferase